MYYCSPEEYKAMLKNDFEPCNYCVTSRLDEIPHGSIMLRISSLTVCSSKGWRTKPLVLVPIGVCGLGGNAPLQQWNEWLNKIIKIYIPGEIYSINY